MTLELHSIMSYVGHTEYNKPIIVLIKGYTYYMVNSYNYKLFIAILLLSVKIYIL